LISVRKIREWSGGTAWTIGLPAAAAGLEFSSLADLTGGLCHGTRASPAIVSIGELVMRIERARATAIRVGLSCLLTVFPLLDSRSLSCHNTISTMGTASLRFIPPVSLPTVPAVIIDSKSVCYGNWWRKEYDAGSRHVLVCVGKERWSTFSNVDRKSRRGLLTKLSL